jgi:hypothetical protein
MRRRKQNSDLDGCESEVLPLRKTEGAANEDEGKCHLKGFNHNATAAYGKTIRVFEKAQIRGGQRQNLTHEPEGKSLIRIIIVASRFYFFPSISKHRTTSPKTIPHRHHRTTTPLASIR